MNTSIHDSVSDLVPSIRRATAADAADIAALLNCISSYAEKRATEGEVRQLQQQGNFLVLDRISGGLAATIYVQMTHRRGQCGLLSVAPDVRGNDLARRLVAIAEALCEAEGCTAVDLRLVNGSAEVRPLYHSLGYRDTPAQRPVGKPLNGVKGGVKCGAFLWMTKALA